MSGLTYPSVKSYKLPKKNILVISCMDLRLTDNLVDFLHFDNLHNRFDHVVLAGASLLCTEQHQHLFVEGKHAHYSHWKKTLIDHINIAVTLHHIQDIYIVEHQDCGAYANFLDKEKVDVSTFEKERKLHKRFAKELSDEIHGDLWPHDAKKKERYQVNVHCFFY